MTFDPTVVGVLSAAVTLSDNAPSKFQKVPVNGVGVLPAVKLSSASITFPKQVVFTTSAAKMATLTNTGLGVLEITSIVATGPFAQTNTCGATLNPSASCTISIAFSPKTIGTLTGSIVISDNAASKHQKLALTGIGTSVQLTPLSVKFGNQPVNTTSLAKTITLSNKGHATVSITSISIVGVNAGDFGETNIQSATAHWPRSWRWQEPSPGGIAKSGETARRRVAGPWSRRSPLPRSITAFRFRHIALCRS